MKKIPSLFDRDWNGRPKLVLPRFGDAVQNPLTRIGLIATRKWDGTACLIKDGKLYKRHDVKKGSKWFHERPDSWIPCQEMDEKTGHWPHWAPVGDGPEDKYHREAFARLHAATFVDLKTVLDGTYELCGPHFQTNAEKLERDILIPHGKDVLAECPGIEGSVGWGSEIHSHIQMFLRVTEIEGVVWHGPNGPVCKAKRSDFDLPWPVKNK